MSRSLASAFLPTRAPRLDAVLALFRSPQRESGLDRVAHEFRTGLGPPGPHGAAKRAPPWISHPVRRSGPPRFCDGRNGAAFRWRSWAPHRPRLPLADTEPVSHWQDPAVRQRRGFWGEARPARITIGGLGLLGLGRLHVGLRRLRLGAGVAGGVLVIVTAGGERQRARGEGCNGLLDLRALASLDGD